MPSDPFTSFWSWLTGKAVQGSGFAADKALSGAEGLAPSTRAIDHLRSASQHRRELRELQNLYHQLDKHAAHAEESYNQLSMRAIQRVLPHTADSPMLQSACRLCVELLEYEGLFRTPEVTHQRALSISEIWELTASVRRQLRLLESPQTRQLIEELLGGFLQTLIPVQLRGKEAEDEGETFTSVPLYMQYADPAEVIETIIRTTFHTPEKDGTFDRLGDRLSANIHLVSGIDPERSAQSQRALVMPSQAADKTPSELVEAYLAGTPFLDFCNLPLPYTIPQIARFEHMHVVGGSGHGKTQLLQSFILRDRSKKVHPD
jgi:hypothetical protein